MISVLTVSVLMIRVLMISAVLRCNIGATGALRAAPGQGPGPCRQERERWSCALRDHLARKCHASVTSSQRDGFGAWSLWLRHQRLVSTEIGLPQSPRRRWWAVLGFVAVCVAVWWVPLPPCKSLIYNAF